MAREPLLLRAPDINTVLQVMTLGLRTLRHAYFRVYTLHHKFAAAAQLHSIAATAEIPIAAAAAVDVCGR